MIDITGQKFGRLTVIRLVEHGKHGDAPKWECRCDCGNIVVHRYAVLKNGHSLSCGCLRKEMLVERQTKHGDSQSRLYQVWLDMKKRCSNPKYLGWKDYGGRGITFCKEWEDYVTFHAWAMTNGYRDDLMIDRINNDGNYESSNCRWVNRKIQNNNKGNHILLTHQGITKNLQQWADDLGLHRETLIHRLKVGWPIEKAFTHLKMTNN